MVRASALIDRMGMSTFSGASIIMRMLETPTRAWRNMKKIGPPSMYPRIEYASIVKPPMAKSQFLIDLMLWVLRFGSDQAAPVMRMREPMRPVRNVGVMRV